MLKTIIGILLHIIPFLGIFKFKDRKIGFVYILSLVICFNLVISIFTQALGIFKYGIIISMVILGTIIVVIKFSIFKKIRLFKIDWIVILLVLISFLHLYQVHYNYSGKYTIASIPTYQVADKLIYPYPYFVDEWYAIAFSEYSMENGKLPLINPLKKKASVVNYEFLFHSFIAGELLIMDLDPLTDYTKLSIVSGILIVVLIYLFLRINKINKYVAGITSFFALYITNGANLPGIWTLIPLIMGILTLMIFIIGMQAKEKLVSWIGLSLCLIFYPPLVIFCLAIILGNIILKKIMRDEEIPKWSNYLYFLAGIVFIIILNYIQQNDSFYHFIQYIWSAKIFYPTFTKGFIPQFLIFKIIPIWILMFSVVGLLETIKKRSWLVVPFLLGLLYWWLYSFLMFRFIIEYERVIVVTAIFSVILAGFGLNKMFKFFIYKKWISRNLASLVIIVLMLSFVFLSFNYTKNENWIYLRLKSPQTQRIYQPAAPANQYLTSEDLRLFGNISGKRFLSLPWKGTVIGTATSNFPAITKQGTISNNPGLYASFLKENCEDKKLLLKERKIHYVYTFKLNCPNLVEVGVSKEGLYLYKVIKD